MSDDGGARPHREVLHESARTRVVRIGDTGGGDSIIHKVYLGSGAQRRLRHERAILDRLADTPGVVRLVEASTPEVLSLADVGRHSLATAAADGPVPVADLLAIAAELAHVLAAVHQRGVVHRDITPANVFWSGRPRRITVIDFDLSTTAAEQRPGFTHQDEIAGTLAYIAPEQTGRTGRAADHRVDFYGFGSTLYHLATGAPPFGFANPLRLIHDHLARVPTPPIDRNPALPPAFSDIILRLLEKEPARRYHSAEGLEHDLRKVREAHLAGWPASLTLGERDFPSRLSAPSHLVGREQEIKALRDAFDAALDERERLLLVSGAPGVGKTSLMNELRPIAASVGGWFVRGKFDQYRQDAEADAVRQALRGLGRLLLAEPEAEIAELRDALLAGLGGNAGIVAAHLPEFASILGAVPEEAEAEADPVTRRARMNQAGLDLLRAMARADRPIVIVLDDLQWATATPLGFLDAVVLDRRLRDVLLVGAYRQTEVDAAHPLTASLARWSRLGTPLVVLKLANLPAPALETMIGEMLRIGPRQRAAIAAAIEPHTHGNPYDTVELINALRRDGALVLAEEGWRWDAGTLRGYLGWGDVFALVTRRIAALPDLTRDLLEIMACLGGEVDADLLGAASDLPPERVEAELLPALEDGLLVTDDASGSISFRHDRVQQAAFAGMAPDRRTELRLRLARRLLEWPRYEPYAAEQYLKVRDAVVALAERRRLVDVFRRAAVQATSVADHARAERFISAAWALLAPDGPLAAERPVLVAVAIRRHATLHCLNRASQADDAYGLINELTDDPLVRAQATPLQISNLTLRNRPSEAVDLGLDVLGQLGLPIPREPSALAEEIEHRLDLMYEWVASGDGHDDLTRPECGDPAVLAMGTILDRIQPPAFFCGHPAMAWALAEACRLWVERGPARALAGAHAYAQYITVPLRRDYRTGSEVVRRALTYCEAKRYEPETSHIRAVYALSCSPWVDPLEESIAQARQAQERLIRAGELQYACDIYYTTLTALLDCAATLDDLAAEYEASLAFTTRTGSRQAEQTYRAYRQFVHAMGGDPSEPCGMADGSFDAAAHFAEVGANQTTIGFIHTIHGLAAAVFGHGYALAYHGEALTPLLPFLDGGYIVVAARLVRALALARRAREAVGERAAALEAFDSEREWFSDRARDVPANFTHLVTFLDAERAWAAGDVHGASRAFDSALGAVARRRRPWHHALIAERAALLQLECGFEYGGTALLREARRRYQRWGATAKVGQLDERYPALRSGSDAEFDVYHSIETGQSGSISTEEIDLFGVLEASQALSSETNLSQLRERVKSVLRAMTGATDVLVILLDEHTNAWSLPATGPRARQVPLPLSAIRYAERTQEPLVVDDATRDERFGRDPYFTGLRCCSLLVVPIRIRGACRAMLLLENRLSRTAFTADRLGSVMLIAGQLAVSLDNALLYASLERKVAERTEELGRANQRLEALSVTDALTGLANRRCLAEVLDREWRSAFQRRRALALAMLDLDYFKAYNDRRGHLAGDKCLRQVASLLGDSVRATDLVARYGGEEFVIVMPGARLPDALRVAERIRCAVSALEQPHEGSPLGHVTISVGVAATTPTGVTTPEELIESADHALYLAKRRGRDQVAHQEIHPDPPMGALESPVPDLTEDG